MKNIIEIFQNDIREIFRKTRTWIVIIGLILLPSMYAWPNILSAWDPYGHTNNIKVAVVTEDSGAEVSGQKVNLGENLVEGLKNNKNLDWQFVSNKQEAEEGVRIGDYYASIVIPKKFSEDLTSVSRGFPKKATIEYTVNEKINAISPKITNSGASAIANNISKSFVEIANGVIFEKLHEAGIKFEQNLPSIEKMKEEIFKLNDNFSNYENVVSELIGKTEQGQKILNTIQQTLPDIDRFATNSIMLADKADITINNIQSFNEKLLPLISNHLKVVEDVSGEANSLAQKIQSKPDNVEETKEKLKLLNTRLEAAEERLRVVKNIFEYLNELSGENILQNQLNKINTLENDLTKVKEVNNKIYTNIDNYDEIADDIKKDFVDRTKRINEISTNIDNRLNDDIAPLVAKVLTKADININEISKLIIGAQNELPEVEAKILSTEVKIQRAHAKLITIQKELPEAKEKIKKLTEEIKKAEAGTNTNMLFNLLKVDYKQQAEFFANPVQLSENKLYHIKNYGSAMTPFYTVLSIWVGALLMSSLLTTKVEDEEGKYKPCEKYFGRWILFLVISLFQTLVITLGDMYILGTQAVSPYRFVFYGLLISALFSSIIYTIVHLLGNVGKAICIILLVLQLGSSGGTFPIQMTSSFFQTLYPKVPFTYSIGLLREAVGGVYIPAAQRDMKILLIGIVITLISGTILVHLKSRSKKLSAEREKSKLFL
ncbi:YhgE/Pip domain-containing protein [Gemella morbillorum]|uniref:YhgE/Pip domain-containing protein n=1 Tax=Gemella morbillorum TaxID=29391 RepID=UPI0025503A30|nr:YhgE/Pip domain-containing protein [Gemella morbillorum]MDK8239498.1 YhgE/Pip domain-containing protein [Gemella morbillorum]MDK8255066.1 YhgE/Pip domain-containing protein [Gemella morbillorum]